ncbi:MAG: PD40 domain-containing protein [Bacteroidetes bacterium]|nr:PD40 domain-containing protein [Bacteroidota bacterium]
MKYIRIFLILVIFSSLSISSSFAVNSSKFTTELKDKDKFKIKKAEAWLKYQNHDYNGALRIYRDLYETHANDAELNFLIGRCHLELQSMEQAIKYFDAAKKIDAKVNSELSLMLGKAYQFLGDIEKAIEQYTEYKNSLPEKQQIKDGVNEFLNQCVYAKDMMSKPVDVTIKNMGKEINSEFDDAIPSISADGKTFIFTSRRPDTKGAGIDPNTGNYFDDIYISNWNDESNSWSVADNAEGDLNTEGHDACLSISPDGNSIFVYRNIEGVTGSGDIYISNKRNDDKWSSPKTIGKPVNSTYFESSACITADGKTVYFISERQGGSGNADIWKSTKIDKDLWGKPENLGPVINTIEDELGVFIHPDGKTLFFTSKGHKNMGGYDVFMSTYENGKWSEPANLGYPINTTKDETHFVLSTDGKKGYVSSRKDNGMGGIDIYEIDMSRYVYPTTTENIVSSTTKDTVSVKQAFKPELSILKGNILDSETGQRIEADVDIVDVATGIKQSISTNEQGEYFVTLTGNKEYNVLVGKNGYKKYEKKVMLPLDSKKTFILSQAIVLEKVKE